MISRANIPNSLTRTARRIRLNSGGGTLPPRPDSILESLYKEYEQTTPEHEQHNPLNEIGFDIAEALAPGPVSANFIKAQRARAHAPAKAAQEKLTKKIELAQVLDKSRQDAYKWALEYEQKDREIASKAKEQKQNTGYSASLMKELSNLETDANNSEDFIEKLDRAESYVDNETVKPGGWTGSWKNTPVIGRVLNFVEGDNNAHVQDLDSITNELNIAKGKSQVGMQHLGPKMVGQLAKDKPGLDKDKDAFKKRAKDFRSPNQRIIAVRDGVNQLIEQGASEAEIKQYLLLARAKHKGSSATSLPSDRTSSDELTTEEKRAVLKANAARIRTNGH